MKCLKAIIVQNHAPKKGYTKSIYSASHNPFTSPAFEILGSREYDWIRTRSIQGQSCRCFWSTLNADRKV